jgi:hypothetical protein
VTPLMAAQSLAHLFGLSLGLGCATAKLSITRLIILGLVLLTLSGVIWLLKGYPFTPRLVVKLTLVAVLWVLGPIIDNVIEPRFRAAAPGPGEEPSAEFVAIRSRYLLAEWLGTGAFYAVVVLWVLK